MERNIRWQAEWNKKRQVAEIKGKNIVVLSSVSIRVRILMPQLESRQCHNWFDFFRIATCSSAWKENAITSGNGRRNVSSSVHVTSYGYPLNQMWQKDPSSGLDILAFVIFHENSSVTSRYTPEFINQLFHFEIPNGTARWPLIEPQRASISFIPVAGAFKCHQDEMQISLVAELDQFPLQKDGGGGGDDLIGR